MQTALFAEQPLPWHLCSSRVCRSRITVITIPRIKDMLNQDVFLKIVRYAVKAPSGHNTQPWTFALDNNTLIIRPDFSRSLPVVDPDHHALYISLGCAVENAVLAAACYGYRTEVGYQPQQDQMEIHLRLMAEESLPAPELFPLIQQRQVTRSAYLKEPIPVEQLQQLQTAAEEEGVAVRFFTDAREIASLMPFIIEGSDRQFGCPEFVTELVGWIRFSAREAMRLGDGLWTSAMGLPPMGRWLGRWIMTHLVTAKSEARRWRKLIDASAGLALFMVRENDPVGWIRLGRAFQRFGLKATQLNVRHAHVNMPCEETAVRGKLEDVLALSPWTPLLLIRFGYGKTLPYSLRRPVDKVIHPHQEPRMA